MKLFPIDHELLPNLGEEPIHSKSIKVAQENPDIWRVSFHHPTSSVTHVSIRTSTASGNPHGLRFNSLQKYFLTLGT